MNRILFIVLLLITSNCNAESLPCANKGGISHCDGLKFVCKDETVEKKTTMDCSAEFYNQDSKIPGDTDGDGVLSGSEQYLYNTESAKAYDYDDAGEESGYGYQSSGTGDGAVHTGPRGGRYTITSGGNKSYIPRR